MRTAIIAALLAGAVGCGGPSDKSTDLRPGARKKALVTGNGKSLNGKSLNGKSLNGKSLNGKSLNGISLNGKSLNGKSLNGVKLQSGQVIAVQSDGSQVGGIDVVGLILTGILDDGSSLDLRVAGVSTLGPLYAYDVTYQSDLGTQGICGPAADGSDVLAFPLDGIWDYSAGTATGGSWSASATQFTFACREGALGKCTELGYQPWQAALQPYHQACTRMMRGDYCGDGTAWTVDDTQIDVSDRLGIQTPATAWPIEASWVPGGATCITSPGQARFHLVHGRAPPACVAQDDRCGTPNAATGLVTDQFDPH